MRTSPSSSYKSKGYLKPGTYTIKATKNGWGQLKTNGYWINLKYVNKSTENKKADSSYKVRVKAKDLNMRTGPSSSYKSKGYLKPGTYTIKATKNGWGQLKTNGYWINLKYVNKSTENKKADSSYKVRVKVKDLNMRTSSIVQLQVQRLSEAWNIYDKSYEERLGTAEDERILDKSEICEQEYRKQKGGQFI